MRRMLSPRLRMFYGSRRPSSLSDTSTFREFARVFGVDFFSVLSRGSQFKVESFMFRIAKPESFVLLSPSKQDVSFIELNKLLC